MKTTIELTNQCSLNCVHCSSCASPVEQYMMPFEKYKQFLKQFSPLEVTKLSGGEPFHHPQISEIIRITKEDYKAEKVEILSSGNYKGHPLPKRVLEECRPYLDRIMFSIYGYAIAHNAITKTQGSRRNLERTVEECIEQKIPFKFETVAMPGVNLREIFNYIKNFNGLDYKPSLKIMHLVNQGRAVNLKKLSKSEVENFKKEALELSKEYNVETRFSCSLTENCTAGEGKRAIIITKNGELRTVDCSSMKHPTTKKFGCLH